MNTSHILSPIAALLFTIILIPFFRKIACTVGLVDKPNHRKVHQDQIPLVGGISIFISASLALLLSMPFEMEIFANKNIFIATFILLIMGVIDDRFELRASLRLSVQLLLAHYTYEQGIKIESFYGIAGIYDLAPWVQYLLTIVVIAGVVNAFNLMDGIDGLAAGIAIVGFLVFTVISIILGQFLMTLIFLTLIGSLLAFLRFNLSKKQKIFMGDAGSIVLGFILVVSGIKLLQSASGSQYTAITALGVVAVLLVPVFDALRVFRKRAKSGKSPFAADRTHLHHLILAIGLKHNWASLVVVSIVLSIVGISLAIYKIAGITISIVVVLIVFYLISSMLTFNNKLNIWKAKIAEMEKNHEF